MPLLLLLLLLLRLLLLLLAVHLQLSHSPWLQALPCS